MHSRPRRTLRRLLTQYGPTLLDNPARVDALLADLCGEYLRERFLLVHALRVRASDANLSVMFWLGSCSQRLQSRYCFSAEAAQWAVESWSSALNIAPPDPNAFHDGPELSNSPRHTLSQLLTACGPDLLNETARIDALLADLCGELPRERFLLVHALREWIPSSLLVQEGSGHERLLSQRLQKSYGFSAQAVQWTIASWSWALQNARSAHDRSLAEAVREQATAEESAQCKAKERNAAEAVALQKKKEWLEAEATARRRVEERLAAEAAAQQKAREQAEAAAAAHQKEKELPENILKKLEQGPSTSRELAKILQAEQEHVIALLNRFRKEGRIAQIWLPRSPYSPCYQIIGRPNALPPDQDRFPAPHRGWRWLAILAATLLLTGIGTALGMMEGVISQWPPAPVPVSSPTLTQTATPEQPTVTPTLTPIPESPLATINRVTDVRRGPGTHHAIIDVADIGEKFPIIGKNAPGDWWQIDYRGEKAWVYAPYVTATNAVNVKIAPTPTPSPPPVTATPTPSPYVVLQVAAQEIIDDYNKDRSEADEKYKGVVLEVFGEIARVKKDEKHYIIFNIKGGPDNVRCNLAPGQVGKWARLNVGDRVVVVGTGRGKNMGPWGDFNLDACTLNPPRG